jgi:hypothetical protein
MIFYQRFTICAYIMAYAALSLPPINLKPPIMRQLLYLLFFAVCSFAALDSSAQKPWPVYFTDIPQPQPYTGTITNIPPVRLLAYGASLYNGTQFKPVDSAVYTYPVGRTWDTVTNTWAFNFVQHYDDPKGNYNLSPTKRTIQYYNVNGQMDSLIRDEPGRKVTFDKAEYTYKNNRIVKIRRFQNFPVILTAYIDEIYYTYDTLGRLIEKSNMSYGVDTRKKIYVYNNNGELTKEYGFLDASVSGNFIPSDTVWHTYVAGNRTESAYRSQLSTGWGDSRRDVYVYNSSKQLTKEYIIVWNRYNTNRWDTMFDASYTYDASGNNDTIIRIDKFRYINTWERVYKTYNTNGLVLTTCNDFWDSASSRWQYATNLSRQERFYYGLFNLTISDQQDNNTTLNLYPVPASSKLTLDITTKEKQLYITICTLDGRLVRTWNQPLFTNQHKETIDVSAIPAGNYMLRVQSAGGQVATQFSILR